MLEQRLRRVRHRDGPLQHVQVHAFVLGDYGITRQAEVDDHDRPFAFPSLTVRIPHEDVAGGEVAVDEPAVVHLGHRAAHLRADILHVRLGH